MLDAHSFRLTTDLKQRDLEDHPIWSSYEDPDDRTAIVSWGVDEKWLTRVLDSFPGFAEGYTHPFYPVLDLMTASGGMLLIKAEFTFANGERAPGLTYGSHAFGIFVDGRTVLFNLNLPDHAKASAAVVRTAYSRAGENVFPAICRHALDVPGTERERRLLDFWTA